MFGNLNQVLRHATHSHEKLCKGFSLSVGFRVRREAEHAKPKQEEV